MAKKKVTTTKSLGTSGTSFAGIGLFAKFQLLGVIYKFWHIVKNFLSNPLVYKFIDHVVEQTTWTNIDNEIWSIIRRAMGLHEDEVGDFMDAELKRVQKAYDDQDGGFTKEETAIPPELKVEDSPPAG